MTAARLSPAANLLRNSRLFAIPAAIPLPAVEPSSEPISYSDSATTPYPIRAAIETPLASLNQGDWGLKRPLPIKTTTKSGTPLVRFRRGIDTPEHVVDFESAADHVLTFRKYQELNLRVTLPKAKSLQDQRTSPFEEELDHTANQPPRILPQTTSTSWLDETPSERTQHLPKHLKDTLSKISEERDKFKAHSVPQQTFAAHSEPSQTTSAHASLAKAPRRWRYSGPYLANLNGLEFDAFLKSITREKRAAFREVVKQDLIDKRAHEQRIRELDEGKTETPVETPTQVTEEDVTEHMRYLRSEPGKFGPLIAEFFDLADGPKTTKDMTDPWSYGRDTIATELYTETGPPRTHPSAGLSYLKAEAAVNDANTGPRDDRAAAAARLLKTRQVDHQKHVPYIGVGGFVVPQPEAQSMSVQEWKWTPVADGPKLVVTPLSTSISQAGKVEIKTKYLKDWNVKNDLPVPPTEGKAPGPSEHTTTASTRISSSQLPPLDRAAQSPRKVVRNDVQDISEEMDFLAQFSSRR
ncbi:hypothetical protein H2200_005869 [Cladophialophora chaetospira]|uniref:Uncharacterized protein n=1 Tax=Cladophialophora chaetospira TaxID=386627 RepID=A0AA38X9V4_9EURO|nr:hypothetical protein H2200_005869 [Cladophialophora chaetospira]